MLNRDKRGVSRKRRVHNLVRQPEHRALPLSEQNDWRLAAFECHDLPVIHPNGFGYSDVLNPGVLAIAALNGSEDHQFAQYWVERGFGHKRENQPQGFCADGRSVCKNRKGIGLRCATG